MEKFLVTVTYSDSSAYTTEVNAKNPDDARAEALNQAKQQGCELRIDKYLFDVQTITVCPECGGEAYVSKDMAYCKKGCLDLICLQRSQFC